MATKTRAPVSDFLTAAELADRLKAADTKTLDAWIAAGKLPPPWLWAGPRKRLWRTDHYIALLKTGEWPI